MSADERGEPRGVLPWFARNVVAANILMVVILAGGAFAITQVRQEVFPEVDLDIVAVSVPYPGASPEEVEEGVVLPVEEAVRGLDGVKEVRSVASEGMASVLVELLLGANPDRALNDVKSAVDRITNFPRDIERPNTFLVTTRQRVVSLVVYGDASEKALRQQAEEAREDLLQLEEITTVELFGVRRPEISIEVPQENLRRYGLTLPAIAERVAAGSVEIPGGGLRTPAGEILVRTTERKEHADEFASIVLRADPQGGRLTVGDVGTVRDTFEESGRAAWFNGERAVLVEVFRVGDQTPTEVSEAVHAYIRSSSDDLPPSLRYDVWFDQAEFYRDRIRLLIENGLIGLLLVLIILGLFLESKLAFWVTLGIPISFAGGLLLMPWLDVSINMISLFAFIIVLGIVVDDAIVVGESTYLRRERGMGAHEASVAGVREVVVPVAFAVTTTIVAFLPMLLVPGFAGKLFRNVPLVVIPVLLFSLVESFIILPAHLAYSRPGSGRGAPGWIHRQQQRFSHFVEWLIEHTYVPTLAASARRRYLTIAVAVAVLLASIGLVIGGRVEFVFFPRIESDIASVVIELPVGAPVEETQRRMEEVVQGAVAALADHGGETETRGIFAQVGAISIAEAGGPVPDQEPTGDHLAEVAVYLVPADDRAFTAADFTRTWREKVGELPGVERLRFEYSTGGTGEAPVAFDLSHPDQRVLEVAAGRLAERLRHYAGVFDVDDGFTAGKEQLDFTLTAAGRSLGITEEDLGRQLRASFFGAEALRQQRGRDELRIYVRLPEAQRTSLHDLERLLVRTPQGVELPLDVAAQVERGRSYTTIERKGGQRIAPVTADVDPAVTNANVVTGGVAERDLPALQEEFPRLTWELGGEQEEQQEVIGDLGSLFVLALLVVYALLGIAFRSYVQPAIIMTAIPFGFVGAVLGHLLLGYELSLMSMFGVVALAGVVVNDSLLFIVAINRFRAEGCSAQEAVQRAGSRRFRPILLTSLTTFFGLFPMILETSVQARFLIPMAISLGFGVLFATFITLLLVPALYLALVDVKCGARAAAAETREAVGRR